VGTFLIGFALLPLVGCSGDTGSQPTGSQNSEDSQSAETGSERSVAQESEPTHEVTEHCGPQASEESETTDQAAQHGVSIEHISGYGGFLLRVDGIVYDTPFEGASNQMTYDTTTSKVVGRRLENEDLGPLFAEATHEVTHEETKESTDLTTTSSSAASSDVVPVYAVEGYDTSFRLAACLGDCLIMLEALSNPRANEASDVLDIGGKVSSIDITGSAPAKEGKVVYGSIEDPEKVQLLVRGLQDAPLEQTSILELSKGNSPYGDYLEDFLIVFQLEDGTAVGRDYWAANGRLSNVAYGVDSNRRSAIVTPPEFLRAFEKATKGYREYVAPTKAEKQRQKLTCGDTETTNEARRIGQGGIFFTTNDIFPSGPWGGVVKGTEKDDSLVAGGNGEDEVYGLGGDDRVEGGICDDKIYGGPGDDGSELLVPAVTGGAGRDIIYGGPGKDLMVGEEGDDVLYGGDGNDRFGGDSGKDVVYGGDGDDTLSPGKDGQRDEIHCGKGNDVVLVGSSADKIDHADDSCEEKQPTSPIVA